MSAASAPAFALESEIAAPLESPTPAPPNPPPAPPPCRAGINRQNAQLSTGPRTEAGKLRSSLNSLRHGLTSRTVVLPTEDAAAYDAHLQRFIQQFQPQGPLEEQLVQSLASTAWRLNRIPALEADLLIDGFAEQTRALVALS